jgi:hypothetical protein
VELQELQKLVDREKLRREELQEASVDLAKPIGEEVRLSGAPMELMPDAIQRSPGVLPPKWRGEQ